MVVVVFRSRLLPGVESEAETLGARMYELATRMPGFISYNDYAGADGESATVVEFASHETLAAWREHPEHRQAQAVGRERLFRDYRITVCDVVRDYSFETSAADAGLASQTG